MYHFTLIEIAQNVMSSNIRLILSTDIIFICIPRRKLNKSCQLEQQIKPRITYTSPYFWSKVEGVTPSVRDLHVPVCQTVRHQIQNLSKTFKNSRSYMFGLSWYHVLGKTWSLNHMRMLITTHWYTVLMIILNKVLLNLTVVLSIKNQTTSVILPHVQ